MSVCALITLAFPEYDFIDAIFWHRSPGCYGLEVLKQEFEITRAPIFQTGVFSMGTRGGHLVPEGGPRLFFEDFDEFVAFGPDAGAEGDHEVGWFVADVEGCVHLVFGNVDGVAGAEDFFLGADPLFDGAAHAGDDFFLVGVFVKVMSLAGEELDVDDGEVLVAGGGRTAEPGEFSPVEFFGGRVGSQNKFAHDVKLDWLWVKKSGGGNKTGDEG